MSTKFKSVGPVGPAAGDGGPWSEDDMRELRLVLMADQLSQMALPGRRLGPRGRTRTGDRGPGREGRAAAGAVGLGIAL